VASAGLAVVRANPATAASGSILPPFDIGTTWNICQGYDSQVTHLAGSTSEYGLDLTGSGCNSDAAGRNVRAPMDGTVSYWQASTGTLCVNIAGSRSYALTHIDATVTSGSVTAGQLVGTIAAAGTRANNNLAHLHFQIWGATGCYNSSVIPFDSANGTRICGAPDLTASGPNSGSSQGTWSGTSFTASDCTDTTGRIGVLDANGVLWVKEGSVDAPWQQQATGVSEFHLSSNRVGILQNGVLSVKEGGLSNGWSQQATGVSTFRLTDLRVGILQGDTFSVKEGALTNGWSQQGTGVSAIDVSPNRIGMLQSGTLAVKEGGLTNGWSTLATGVSSFRVLDARVGILQGGTFSVKEGALTNGWSQQATGVSSMDVSPNRIGILQSGTFSVKEGSLSNGWTQIATNASGIRVIDTRVGVFQSGTFSVKEGTLTNGWTPEMDNSTADDLS